MENKLINKKFFRKKPLSNLRNDKEKNEKFFLVRPTFYCSKLITFEYFK